MGGDLAGRRILIVEDEYLIASELRMAFERAGAELIGPVPDVAKALELLALTQELDGAVLDINLGGEMAYPVAEALRARNVPFVFATGYDAQHIPAEFRSAPRYEKPIQPDQIAAALFG